MAKREGTNSAGFRPCNFSFKVYFYVKLFLKTLADISLIYSKIHRPRNPHICITYIIIISPWDKYPFLYTEFSESMKAVLFYSVSTLYNHRTLK